MELKGKHVLVVGLAKSGIAAARLLVERGAKVRATDAKAREALGDAPATLEKLGVELLLGSHPDSVLDGIDLVVTSPGVPEESKPLALARKKNVEVIGELELAWRELDRKIPVIAITGSNGKSTTTSLTAHLLRESGVPVWVGGNLGTPFSEFHLTDFEVQPKWIVLEVSSFMLETAPTFAPKIAAILNVSPNHLDRHPSLEAYAEIKARIWRQAKFVVFNADDPVVSRLARSANKEKRSFGVREGDYRVIRTTTGYAVRFNEWDQEEISLNEFPCPGEHNAMNAAAALAMANLAFQVSTWVWRTEEQHALGSFKPLEHRLERCGEAKGVTFYNDSKATTTAAMATSIAVFDKSIVLAGGKDKGGDWNSLREAMKTRVKRLVTYGYSRELISEALAGTTDVRTAQNLAAAFAIATENLAPGDVVLLSPGCASYDQFANFEDRGRQFKALVASWTAAHA